MEAFEVKKTLTTISLCKGSRCETKPSRKFQRIAALSFEPVIAKFFSTFASIEVIGSLCSIKTFFCCCWKDE